MGVVLLGCGHLGSYHLQKLLQCKEVDLIALIDPNLEAQARARAVLAEHSSGAAVLSDLNQLGARLQAQIGAAIIACPTSLHHDVGTKCLAFGWHVLIEKPLADTVMAAERLVLLAQQHKRVLCVGHIERFNPAIEAALPLIEQPRFVVSERLGPFTERSVEIDVIYDMMVHDFDLLRTVIEAPLAEVRAVGVSVLTDTIDMAAVRLAFANGSVAQLSAGRASLKPARKLRFFCASRYVSIDCQARSVSSVKRLPPPAHARFPTLSDERIAVAQHDPLTAQLDNFVAACRATALPRVDGQAGLAAVRMAAAVHTEIVAARSRYMENDSPQLQL